MSFQGLISGSECGVQSNPLSQVLKHTEGDRSLQQDRISGPSSSRLHHLPGTAPQQANDHDVAMARQFFEAQQPGPGQNFTLPPHIHPAELLRLGELNGRPDLNEAWMREQQYKSVLQEPMSQSSWAAEFGHSADQIQPTAVPEHNMSVQQRPSYMGNSGMYGGSMPYGIYGGAMNQSSYQGFSNNYALASDQAKGKGKSREVDFEEAFAQAAASFNPIQAETSRIVEVDESVTDIEQALRGTVLEDDTKTGVLGSDFPTVWEHLQQSGVPPPHEDMAKWEAEFNQLMTSQREEIDHDYSTAMQDTWESGLGGFGEHGFVEEPQKFDDEGLPILSEYIFETSNKYLDPSTSTRSPLGEAKLLLQQNGSLSEAALLLEAAIQKGDLGEGGYEAWILLGETRNMDEREDLGMRALTEGVKRAEAAGADGAGMLSLAISYTNESYDRGSYTMLLRWLRARFPTYAIPEETGKAVASNSTWDSHGKLTDAFLGLARSQFSQGLVDPDVQIALGVLFYNTGEYDRAKDCFESALSGRPQDYLLWNRLGSSLSNGNKPEEALGAYREALHLRPTYTRAIYNVGVACLNIGAHQEAAEHFLSALAMQEATGGGQTSDQLWFTLRRTFLSMDRTDLAEIAKPESHPTLELFRQKGFDF
ncbi:hypothetical protein SERLA73DRAFT_180560 [Serpula lacrymans var. lacrymans S7.3]|uniref:Uncharacterized protein n=2 Tax=Serpula lacrymans var. lacrymans TaxID=341189 RepID=F8PV35_SERL3|nr:uncharacterized protein SERLADRAFT_466214 [Serpula lacrymans var. lacrymans S7.9]EGO00115.1 hypothetical protein SERLA73DRAFT_180560 [Serpula lacrymans var. lacrymans S7.3]EGO25677.1 hypothetical protein SERLADRAFT_466214 [Serpula lacrymans var. lacrymans S7.9]